MADATAIESGAITRTWTPRLNGGVVLMAQTMALIGVIRFMFAAQQASSIILLATSESRTLSLLALDQVAAGQREVASITVVLIMFLTLGVALIARSFRLKVGIRAE